MTEKTKKGLLFVCTPFDLESVAELESINLQAYKIASADITNIPLLKTADFWLNAGIGIEHQEMITWDQCPSAFRKS